MATTKTSKNKEEKKQEELIGLINSRIEKLRPKLLDLSRRNPLLSTRFSDKSNSHVRIVDELPDILFKQISEGAMVFMSLPPLDDDPKDEDSRVFQSELADARITEEIYKKDLEAIDEDNENAPEKLAKAERDLKDRIRVKLGMSARQTKKNLSLAQHARNNGIVPSYDLPLPNNELQDEERYQDKKIQTLLLPDLLERRLNAILTKCRTWSQETGIDVLRASFGFLEWNDIKDSRPALAPLMLLPVQIEKRRTQRGLQFVISGLADAPEFNTILAEKLRIDFGLQLPPFKEGITPEEYFKEIEKISPRGLQWRVRRQVAIGVFPSARMAMYHDLDTSKWDFETQPVIKDLFGGTLEAQGTSPFGDEYDTDDPEIEAKVPLTVMDSDSSQFSVMVDVADGKNIAVEGPPGSGKSQTIVNTIASALSQGKKVLFVAEKTAALEVVRSRLEACDLGPFLLTLQAGRSSKEQIIQSIRDRRNIGRGSNPRNYLETIEEFKKTRSKLQSYIEVISSVFDETGMTVYEIVGNSISTHKILNSIPDEIKRIPISNPEKISRQTIQNISFLCDQLEASWRESNSHKKYWQGIEIENVDPFSADEILNIAKKVAKEFKRSAEKREFLTKIGLNEEVELSILKLILDALDKLPQDKSILDVSLIKRLMSEKAIDYTKSYFLKITETKKIKILLDSIFVNCLDRNLSTNLFKLVDIVKEFELSELSIQEMTKKIEQMRLSEKKFQAALSVCEALNKQIKETNGITIKLLITLCEIIEKTDRTILALRNKDFESPEIKEFLTRYKAEADALKKEREELSKVFNLSICSDVEKIAFHNEILSQSGFFSIFSPKYHSAKKFYKSISSSSKWNGANSSKLFQKLYGWLKGEKAFSRNELIKMILKQHFDGINTNFELFEKLTNFYESVENVFRGFDNQYIKNFLFSASFETIMALPKLEPTHPLYEFSQKTPDTLLLKAQRTKEKINLSEKVVKELTGLMELFNNPTKVDLNNLSNLSDQMKEFQEKWSIISDDQDMKNFLDKYFAGINTNAQIIEPSLKVAEITIFLGNEYAQILLQAIQNNVTQNYRETIEQVLQADLDSDTELKNLSSLIKREALDLQQDMNRMEFAKFILAASDDKVGLIAHSVVAQHVKEVVDEGYGFIIKALSKTSHCFSKLSANIRALIAQAMAKEVYKSHGKVLSRFNGIKLDKLRKQAAELDKEILQLSRKWLKAKLIKEATPPSGSRSGKRSEWTNGALIDHELSKTTRYIPVRDLTTRASEALLEMKPCWMVSPLAVAQYIPKGMINFDLVIIDEASQMTPQDSVGALVRGKQAMVVGDTNQLPPTSFFQKFIDDEEEENDDVITEESILEMANAVFRPARRLKWHYRSRHSALIAFSNKYVYNQSLVIFPSPVESRPDMGVSLQEVKGLYSKGTNPIEAKIMIDAAIEFMHKHQEKSLGIVVLNQKQRDLMLEEMNFALANDSSAQKYVESWEKNKDGLESFFIKNLENVQGDERDVMFIGTVYGPEQENAPVMQRFGPINGITGKRRLNVLFTRAKEKIVTFSSMTSSDVRAEGVNEGVMMLKRWLEYSATGRILVDDLEVSHEPDSMFEIHVMEQLKAIGCELVPQVGVAGYFIDIGVKHSSWPHGFIMGVECDGATYHSSKSTRDRDRLRQEILEGLGWHLHRIWSTDWFDDPIRQSERLREVVENRLQELKVSTTQK